MGWRLWGPNVVVFSGGWLVGKLLLQYVFLMIGLCPIRFMLVLYAEVGTLRATRNTSTILVAPKLKMEICDARG